MNLNLVDELTQKQANKFQLNKLDAEFIDKTLLVNSEGSFNLPSATPKEVRERIFNHLRFNYKKFEFATNYNNHTNEEIMFKKNREYQNA